jgi:biopolymer transport protein ExbD
MRSREGDSGDLNMTPMLDVVFILLIFFIVTAVFVKEPGIEVNRPVAFSSSSVKPTSLVAVSADDEIWINKELISASELRPTLEALRAENPKAEAIVQGDREARFEITYQVMEALREIGIATQHVSTETS